MRNWLLEAGERSWDWLPEGRSTGRREAAGRGMAEGRGRFEGGSMASTAAGSGGQRNVAVHADRVSLAWLAHNFQLLAAGAATCARTGRPDVTASRVAGETVVRSRVGPPNVV